MFGTGDPKTAKLHFSEALKIAEGLANRITISFSLDGFAAIAVENGDLERSPLLYGAAENLRDLIG